MSLSTSLVDRLSTQEGDELDTFDNVHDIKDRQDLVACIRAQHVAQNL